MKHTVRKTPRGLALTTERGEGTPASPTRISVSWSLPRSVGLLLHIVKEVLR